MKWQIYAATDMPLDQEDGTVHVVFRPVEVVDSGQMDGFGTARELADYASRQWGPQVLVRRLAEDGEFPPEPPEGKSDYQVLQLTAQGFVPLGKVRATSLERAEQAAGLYWPDADLTVIEPT